MEDEGFSDSLDFSSFNVISSLKYYEDWSCLCLTEAEAPLTCWRCRVSVSNRTLQPPLKPGDWSASSLSVPRLTCSEPPVRSGVEKVRERDRRLPEPYLALQFLLVPSLFSQALHQLLGFLLQHCGFFTGGAERGKQTDDKIWSWLLLLVQARTKILGHDNVRSGLAVLPTTTTLKVCLIVIKCICSVWIWM